MIMTKKIVDRLQNEAKEFLTGRKLVLKGVTILPKEIEVYYYNEKEGFTDKSVHGNELQQKNKNHFYVHRWGLKQTDPYKGGNRPGLDFVLSDEENIFYSYLIRSAVINGGELVIGPNKVLKKIIEISGLEPADIEKAKVDLISDNKLDNVLFSERINLGENAKDYISYKLRAVLCDEYYKGSKYPAKERMIVDFLLEKIKSGNVSKEEAKVYAKEKLGYIPTVIKEKCK